MTQFGSNIASYNLSKNEIGFGSDSLFSPALVGTLGMNSIQVLKLDLCKSFAHCTDLKVDKTHANNTTLAYYSV